MTHSPPTRAIKRHVLDLKLFLPKNTDRTEETKLPSREKARDSAAHQNTNFALSFEVGRQLKHTDDIFPHNKLLKKPVHQIGKNLNGKERTTRLLLFLCAFTLSINQKRKNRKMEEMERRDDNEETEEKGFVLFLPYETLVKVFAIIDGDNSKTISGVGFLTALRNNTGGVSQILDSALREKMKGKKKKKKTKFGTGDENERKFELGSKIIAKISGVGEEGIGLSEFVEAFRVVAANEDDDENDDGDDEEEIGDAQYRRRRRRNNGATSNSGGESEMDEDSLVQSEKSGGEGE